MKRQSSLVTNPSAVSRNIDDSAYDNVKIVADNIDVVTPLGEAITAGALTTVTDSIGSINTNAANIADINAVATDIDSVTSIIDDIPTLNEIHANIAEILVSNDNAAIATAQAGIATSAANTSTTNANTTIAIREKFETQLVESGEYYEPLSYDSNTNTLTIPRGVPGVNGENGLTPNYEFTYNEATGDLEYAMTGYTTETDVVIEEII